MILIKIEGVPGDCKIKGFDKYFTAESFSFGVERELADSAKGGTEDVNIGLGELQECSISKSMDTASAQLARRAISGSSCKTAEVKFIEAMIDSDESNLNVCYLAFQLDNVFIKSWSMSGDADDRPTEEVALWYNKIAFKYWPTKDGIKYPQGYECAWDHVTAKPWKDTTLSTIAAAQKFDSQTGVVTG